jgi:hypothetical protein
LKQLLLITILALSAFLLTACTGPQADLSSAAVPLVKKSVESRPVALETVMAGNEAALDFANDTTDFLEGDAFIEFVTDAKERDDDARDRNRVAKLASSTLNLEDALDSLFPPLFDVLDKATKDWQLIDDSGKKAPAPEDEKKPAAPASERYRDQAQGYSLELPSGWTKAEISIGEAQAVKAARPPADAGDQAVESITVGAEDLPLEFAARDYSDLVLERLKHTNFKELERIGATIGGRPAEKIVYTYTEGDLKLKRVMWSVTKDMRGYFIMGTADQGSFDKYAPVFASSADSFKFE